MAKRQAQQCLKRIIGEDEENAVLDERLSDSSNGEGMNHTVPLEGSIHTQSPITASHEDICSAQC